MEKEKPSKGQEEPRDDPTKQNNSPKSGKSSAEKKKGRRVVGAIRKISSRLLDLSSSGRVNRKKSGLDFSGDGNTVVSGSSSTSSASATGMLLDDLPDELIENILAFLNGHDLCVASQTSRRWREMSAAPHLWCGLYNRTFMKQFNVTEAPEEGWKKIFVSSFKQLSQANAKVRNKSADCESFVTRALVHIELQHIEAAIEDLTTAISLVLGEKKGKNKTVSHAGLLMRRASLFRKLNLKERAKADAEQAIKLDQTNANFYRIRGSWAREDRDYEAAMRDFDAAIGLDPGASIHHFFKGLVLREMKDFRLAIEQIDRAIELEPNNAEYYCTRGRMYTYISDYEAALQDLNRAVDYDPQNSDYWHWRGRIRRERQDCAEAMKDFETALRITDDDIDYAWRGIMQSHMKNNMAALEDINKAIALAPSNSFHYQFKGIIYFGMDDIAAARESFAKAIELLPDWAGHYVWRSAASESQDPHAALLDLDKAVQLRPDEVSLFWRALGYLALGELKKAQYDLEAAYKAASPISARIPFWRAIIALLNHEDSEAQRLFDETLRLASSERKSGHFAEPARCFLLRDPNRKKARELYRDMFDGNFTIDSAKTEQSHLELLAQLFPDNSNVKKVLSWFQKTRKNTYLPSVTKPLPHSKQSSSRELAGEKSSSANNLR